MVGHDARQHLDSGAMTEIGGVARRANGRAVAEMFDGRQFVAARDGAKVAAVVPIEAVVVAAPRPFIAGGECGAHAGTSGQP